MQKKNTEEIPTKAKRREIKKRPRMHMSGGSLKKLVSHGGKKLAKR